MRALAMMAVCVALASAELYKETQDFQYSRTSSDDGEKKGYYGSQTGNMGGNFEVSHNMDHMAKGQMHQLIHTVSDQLGMEHGAIGNGRPVAGSVYGSASTSGNTFGAKKATISGPTASVNAQDLASGGSWSRQYDAGSRGVDSQYYGANSQSQHSASGQRRQGNLYTGDGSVYRTDSHEGRVAAVPSMSSSHNAGSTQQGSSWSTYGETASQSGDNRQTGETVYVVPTAGVRESGAATSVSGSQYSQQGAYRGGQVVTYGNEGDAVTPLVVRPGSVVRLSVRPGQNIPIRIPVSSTQHGIQTSQSGQNSGYATNTYDRTLGSADLTNTQRNHDMAILNAGSAGSVGNVGSLGNTGAAGRTGSVGGAGNAKSYESSYSYQKEWESHGGAPTASGAQRNTGDVRTIGQVTDFGAAAQNRDKLFVGGMEVRGEDNTGSTTYNSGSRVASTGQHYAGSNTYRESKGETSRTYDRSGSQQTAGQVYGAGTRTDQSYNGESSRRAAGQTYQYGGAAYNAAGQNYNSGGTRRGDDETYDTRNSHQTAGLAYNAGNSQQDHRAASQVAGSDTNRLIMAAANQPKSYESSFSYKKSWEKHGDPYIIQPATAASDSYGSNIGVQNADLSSMLNQENSGYSAGHRSGSTYGSSSQYDSSRSTGLTAGASHSDDLSANMAAMQDKLRSQMGQACGPNCNTGATKGYSATYSYSAQRSYGGGADTAANGEGRHRYKRHLGAGFGHHDFHNHHDHRDHQHSFQSPTFSSQYHRGADLPTFNSHSYQSGFQPKFSSHYGHGIHEGQSEIPVTSYSYSTSFSSGQGQGSGKGDLLVKLSPAFSGGDMQKELEEKMKKELEEEMKKEMEKHMRHSLSNEKSNGDTHRTYYSQSSRHYSTSTMNQSGESDPDEYMGQKSLTVSSGKLDMSGKKLEKPKQDKTMHGFTSTTYYSSNGLNKKANKGEEADLEVEALGDFENSGRQAQSFSGSGKLLTSNNKLEDLETDSGLRTYHTRTYHSYKPITQNGKDSEETEDLEKRTLPSAEDFSRGRGLSFGKPHQSVSNDKITGQENKDSSFSVSSSHFTTSSQQSSGKLIGKKNEDIDEHTRDLAQKTQDLTNTYGNSEGKPTISNERHSYFTTTNQYSNGKKPQVTNDKGRETQDFSSAYGNLHAKPQLPSSSFHVTDEETEDMGQETQGFSENLFSGSSSQYTNGKKPKTQVSDVGQETQDFSSTYGNLQGKPHLSTGSMDMTGQETQGFSGNLFSGSSTQYTSGKKPKTLENEDVGQETQDFTSTYGNLQAKPQLSSGNLHMTEQEPEYLGQETQDFSSTYGNLQGKPHLSTGNLQMTGQETQGFSGNLFTGSSSQYTSRNMSKTLEREEVGQETQDFTSTYGNLQAKPQFSSGNFHMTGQEPEDLGQETQDFSSTYGNLQGKPHLSTGNLQLTEQETQGFSGNLFSGSSSQYTNGKKPKTLGSEDVGQETQDFSSTYGNLQAKPQLSTGNLHMTGQEPEDLGQETQDFSSTYGNLQGKPHLSTGNLQMTEQETQGFSGNLYSGSSSQYTSGKKPKTLGSEDLSQETQDFSSTYGNLHMTGQETEDLGQQTEDLGQETQNYATSYGLSANSQHSTGKLLVGQETQDLGQQTQSFTQNFGSTYSSGSSRHSTGSLHMTGQETQDLGQQTYNFGQEPSGLSNSGKSYSQSNTRTGPKLQFSNQQGNVGTASSQSSNTNKQIFKTDHINDKDVDSHLDDLLALLGTNLSAAIGKETLHTGTGQTNKLDKNTPKYHYSSSDLSSKPKPLASSGVTEPKDNPFKVNFTMEYQGGRANDRIIPSHSSGLRVKPVIHSSPTLAVVKPPSLIQTGGYRKPAGLNTNDNKESSFLETYKYNSGKITENARSGYTVEGTQADQVNVGSGNIQKPVPAVGNQKLNFAHPSYDAGQQVEQTADWEGEQAAMQHAHVQQQYGQMNAGSLLENHNQDDFYQQSSYGAMQQKQDNAPHGLQMGHHHSDERLNGQFAIGSQQHIHSQNAAAPEKHVVTTTLKPEITTTEQPGIWTRAKDKAKSWFS